MNPYIENEKNLPKDVVNNCRAYASLIEELEAIVYYIQREKNDDTTTDTDDNVSNLVEIFHHNSKEEKEHAAMLLEWIRRNDESGEWTDALQTFLFTVGKIKGR